MAASFAGARNLDERRRRRLASASEETVVSPTPRARTATPSQTEDAGGNKTASVALFPLRKLISPRTWKHWSVGLLLFACGGLLIAAGLHLESSPEQLGPGFEKLFNLESGRAINYFSGGLMTVAGQIAFLIWWARSRSLHDYNGNYRVWAWASTFGILFGFCLLTDAHVAFSLTIFWLWNLDFWKQDVLCWLAPTLVITGGLFWPLRHDMFDCKPSRSLFAIAGGCWVVVALMQIGLDFPLVGNQLAARAAVGMVGALSFFMCMVIHARFVLYETAEAPVIEQKPSLVKKTLSTVGTNVGMNLSGFTASWSKFREGRRLSRSERAEARAKAKQEKADAKAKAIAEKADAKAKAAQEKADRKAAAAEAKVAEAEARAIEREEKTQAAAAAAEAKKAAAKPAASRAEAESDESQPEPQNKKAKPRFRLKSDGTNDTTESNPQWEQVAESGSSDDDDYGADEGDWQHLSRKERKKLRRQQRQQQRKAS